MVEQSEVSWLRRPLSPFLADRQLRRRRSLACIPALATFFVDIFADRLVWNVNAMYDLYSIGSIDGIHLILICRTVQRGMVIARTAAYRLKVKKKSKVCRRTFWVDYVFVWQVVEDSNVCFLGGKTQLEVIAPF